MGRLSAIKVQLELELELPPVWADETNLQFSSIFFWISGLQLPTFATDPRVVESVKGLTPVEQPHYFVVNVLEMFSAAVFQVTAVNLMQLNQYKLVV